MTSIGSVSSNPETAALAGQASGASATSVKSSSASAQQAASSAEAVTVSSDATTTAQLLTAARNADGVDQQAVQQLKNQIQNGTYNIPPDKLATSIAAALNGIA